MNSVLLCSYPERKGKSDVYKILGTGTGKSRKDSKCLNKKGVLATLNKIQRCTKDKFHQSEVTKEIQSSDKKALLPQDCLSMPSSENRTHQNKDAGNYKTTLVLHLRDKTGMSHHHFFKSDKFIDFESNNRYCDSRSQLLVEIGDRVVFVNETGRAELGVIRWLDSTSEDKIAGVEFENPVGDCNGTRHKVQYFQCEKDHGAFIPLSSLVKAEDYYVKPKENGKRKSSKFSKLQERHNNVEVLQNGICRSQLNSKRSELDIKIRPTESVKSVPSTSHNDDVKSKVISNEKSKETNMCRSEYVFSETNTGNASTLDDEITKFIVNDSTSSHNRIRTDETSSSKNGNSFDKYSKAKSSETKIKHSLSQDSHIHNGLDCDLHDIWPSLPSVKNSNEVKTKINTGLKNRSLKSTNSCDIPAVPASELTDCVLHSPTDNHGEGSCYEFSWSPEPEVTTDFTIGSVVEVTFKGEPRYGVIRWIGVLRDDPKARKIAGIEMEQENPGFTDGTFSGHRYFHCQPRKAFFVTLNQCHKDGRFQDVPQDANDRKSKSFGQVDNPVIHGAVPPVTRKEDFDALCGKGRGIQGHHNSCYLDATLFSMFAFTSVFDSLLFRPPTENDITHYEEVQRVLKEEIVNPLRKNLFVRADRVMKLRTLLENLSSVTGLTSEEKDPEEFLTSLVAQILHAEPFLKLSSGQEAYHYQLFVEKDEHLTFPTVQHLFEQSFLASDIKLKEVPSCLIIQMPRFGKSFKMYPRIFPSQILDVTDVIEDSPRQCTVCGKLAQYECKECFSHTGEGLEGIAYCSVCLETVHTHQRRSNHAWRQLTVPAEFSILQDHCPIPRLFMELFAVVCIETSHYVAFVKCGTGNDAPWCFFDSMADRKGEQNGYNIPEVVACPNLPYWLSEEGYHVLSETKDDRQLPEHAKRLICDAYMCMYQSSDVMMYR